MKNKIITIGREFRSCRRTIGKSPCVIVGRCADTILHDKADCLRVFIYADMEYRAKRIVEVYGERENSLERQGQMLGLLILPATDWQILGIPKNYGH